MPLLLFSLRCGPQFCLGFCSNKYLIQRAYQIYQASSSTNFDKNTWNALKRILIGYEGMCGAHGKLGISSSDMSVGPCQFFFLLFSLITSNGALLICTRPCRTENLLLVILLKK